MSLKVIKDNHSLYPLFSCSPSSSHQSRLWCPCLQDIVHHQNRWCCIYQEKKKIYDVVFIFEIFSVWKVSNQMSEASNQISWPRFSSWTISTLLETLIQILLQSLLTSSKAHFTLTLARFPLCSRRKWAFSTPDKLNKKYT